MASLKAIALCGALAGMAALGGCGFRPMYAPAETGSALSQIVVGEIEGKSGHVLKAQLDRLFSAGRAAGADPAYRLSIRLEERLEPIGLRRDSSATRTDLTLTATYSLTDAAGKELFKGKVDTTVGYDVPASAFGEFAAQNDARERAGETLAELVRADVAARMSPPR
jgi:LPS-assembly lipoprotein